MNVDEARLRKSLLQREEIENPHPLTLDADSRAVLQAGERRARRHEGVHVAGLVPPREHWPGNPMGLNDCISRCGTMATASPSRGTMTTSGRSI